MNIRRIIPLLALLGISQMLFAQKTAIYTDADRFYKRGVEFFEKGIYGKARHEFENVVHMLRPVSERSATILLTKSEFYLAKCAILMGQPDGEKLMMDFVRKYRPDPLTEQALIEVANYYFNERDYNKALEFYTQVPTAGLSREKRAEVRFKMGYAYFAKKDFSRARSLFREVADIRGEYYYPTNYYLGLCQFFDGNYSEAIKNLRIAEQDNRYKRHIPAYVAQIYFAERRYDELINYVEGRMSDPTIRDNQEVRQALGQAYFERGDFHRALPHLEYHAQKSNKLLEEELYQLGYAQYQTGQCDKAIANFRPLSTVNSAVGQNAMFYLADCHLKAGQKMEAFAALTEAKRMSYDPFITEEALFNHGKLAYELNQPQAAVNSLQGITPQSKYYSQAQALIIEAVLNYRDYAEAMAILERMPDKTPKMREAYQKVTVYRGIQLLQQDDLEGAGQHFQKSLEFPADQRTRAIAIYWLGDIAHRQKNYDQSINLMNQFITMAKTLSNLPDESSMLSANYIQGYNYFKKNNYTAALQFFQEAAEGIKRNRRFIRNDKITGQMLGDATLRTGDAYFRRNQYAEASRYYDEAISARYPDYVYAMYQKAVIDGLRGRSAEKIMQLERISKDHPNSDFADDALLLLGSTYQEIGKLNEASAPLLKLVREYRTKSNLINQAYIKLGLINYNQGNLNGAISYYKQVFGNNPDPSEASLALSALEEIYVKDLGRPNEYFAFLETIPGYRVEGLSRDSISFRAALTRFESGDYQRAIESYNEYLRNFPNGRYALDAYYQRAESHSVLRQYSRALPDYLVVVERGPSRHYMKALEKAAIITYNHEQDFRKAYELYALLESAAQSEDMRFEAQLGALRSAYRGGNTQAVYTMANRVMNNPNANNQHKSTAAFYLGKVAYDQRDFDSALTAFNQVTRLSDNEQTAEARYLIASIYYQRRDLNRAQELCIKANQESSAYPYWVARSVVLLADVLADKGDLYNARAALEALLDNYNEDAEIVNQARTRLERINKQIQDSSKLNPNPNTGLLEFINDNR
jgi:tetratricopeptide (TPR) repeat protein